MFCGPWRQQELANNANTGSSLHHSNQMAVRFIIKGFKVDLDMFWLLNKTEAEASYQQGTKLKIKNNY